MVYRKTELVLSQIEAKRSAIIAAAIDCLRKDGWSGMTCTAIAERAKISMGKVFYHFPDMTEVAAQVEAVIMARDIDAMISAGKAQGDHPIRALTAALTTLYARLSRREAREMFPRGEAYRINLERQLGHFIGPTMIDKTEAKALAPAVLASVFAMAGKDSGSAKRVSLAVLFILRGLGIAEATAQRALDAVS